jgi:hypothetical protein
MGKWTDVTEWLKLFLENSWKKCKRPLWQKCLKTEAGQWKYGFTDRVKFSDVSGRGLRSMYSSQSMY